MKRALLILVCGLAPVGANSLARADEAGDQVVVVYNRNLSESQQVAEYYARRRDVPKGQVIGLDLPKEESISRSDYQDRLARPLLSALRDKRLLVYPSNHHRADPLATNEFPVQARIRYAALCYGVPVKILSDPKLSEEGSEKIRVELRRNEAAVDSELALLPTLAPKLPVYGAVANRLFAATNGHQLGPTNGLLLVTRLDGPSADIARGLVDKAIQAEADGLWGRAYFDARGLTNGNYKLGDDWIRGAAQVVTRLGFETVLDHEPATFSVGYPMSHIAIYAGWYDGAVSGPFTRPQVEFMPGAFAYHLHSFSAQTIRSTTANWVGPLLAKGATITLGCTEEPYLEGTPDVMTFLIRFIYFGFSFGEAAYACQNSLSWQTTAVGDPLYRPFGRQALEQHQSLVRRKSKLVEWSHLKVVNMNQANGMLPNQLTEYLENAPETRTSAVLQEKLGDLYFLRARWNEAITHFRQALEQSPSPQQTVRLRLSIARTMEYSLQNAAALDEYKQFIKQFPDYPDLLMIYRKALPLAEQLGQTEERDEIQREIQRLAPSPAP
ncbi:MAG: TIGR03790 family protein [Verrucomicrobiota bacterium]